MNDGAEVQTRTGRGRKSSWAMSIRGSAFSTPWLQFHGGGSADVYIIIRVRASGCGESALNPPTSQPIPRRKPAPAPARRRTLPEHFLTPSPRRRTPAGCAMHSSPTPQHIPRRRPSPAPAQRRALPKHFRSPTQPRRTPAGCAMHARRPHNPFLAEDLLPPQHSDTPFPSTSAPPRSPDTRPPTSQHIPHRRPLLAPAQRHSLPAPTHTRKLRHAFLADLTTHSSPKACSRPRTTTRPARTLPLPPRTDARPLAAPTHIPRRRPSPAPAQRRPTSPSVPLRAQKKRHRTVDVRCRMSRSTVVAVGHWGW